MICRNVPYTGCRYIGQPIHHRRMNLREVFARNVRVWRAHRDLSQEALADAAKISRGYMSDIERSEYSASLDVVERIAKALGVEPSQLLERPRRRGVRP